ncbi:MAG: hypothetical protein L6R48_24740 [Planctomycetes bacterium]|nr:hypothetical protein [Planctomycetota bacterium]
MTDPVLVAVPPKGGSFDDVMKRLAKLGWFKAELITALRALIKGDKRRVKLEEGLIQLWRDSGHEYEATMRAADRFGHDLDEVDAALKRMRRYPGADGRTELDYTPGAEVERLLAGLRGDADPEVREAALALHLQLDLTRPGKPSRMVFNHLECDVLPRRGAPVVRAVIMGTDHEVTPTCLRKQKRDLSLTCYDAFHNTMLDVLDTPKVRDWRELTAHLVQTSTDVRILGSLGLDDYLGHCVLMGRQGAARAKALGGGPRWAGPGDPKLALLKERPVLIDPGYEEVYRLMLDAEANGIRFESGPKDIERTCAEQERCALYIVRSGSTVAVTPNLCVVGEELITSETIVAVNQDRLERNPWVGALVDSLQPSTADHAAAWRTRLAAKLGDHLVLPGATP